METMMMKSEKPVISNPTMLTSVLTNCAKIGLVDESSLQETPSCSRTVLCIVSAPNAARRRPSTRFNTPRIRNPNHTGGEAALAGFIA